MKSLILAGLVSMAVTTTASAADISTAAQDSSPAYSEVPKAWSGFYAGVQGGGSAGTSDGRYSQPNAPGFRGSQSYHLKGALVGGLAGYNWQEGSLVYGVEGSYNWSGIDGRSAEVNSGSEDSDHTKLRSFGDIKARIGYASGPALFYVNGGGVLGTLSHSYDAAQRGSSLSRSKDETKLGWTIGTGAEYMFAANWSAKIEYNYVDFGKSAAVTFGRSDLNKKWTDTSHIVKVGLNYHFN